MKYKTIKITEEIVAVQVKDDYDRTMLFCKAQEFYESPCKLFKGKKFSIWDYFRWYSKKFGDGCFSYTKDFVGFNMPLIVAKKCYEINDIETPYDEILNSIVERYFVNGKRKYLIGVESLNSSTFEHEMCHAMYYVDEEYRKKADELTASLSDSVKKKMKKNLSNMGYNSSVFKDEVQAYMATEVNKKFTCGVSGALKIHKKYRSLFKNMRPLV